MESAQKKHKNLTLLKFNLFLSVAKDEQYQAQKH